MKNLSMDANLLSGYMSALPGKDLSTLPYWDQKTLNDIDSEILRKQHLNTVTFYNQIYESLVKDPESPYLKRPDSKIPITREEFLWAFTIVSTRSLVFNNMAMPPTEDPKAFITILPLMDFINHSQEPNCIVLPYHDTVSDQSYAVLKTLRDIKENEQITIGYGDMPNTHLIQKYGFVLPDNQNKKINFNLPYREWQALLYEEEGLKS